MEVPEAVRSQLEHYHQQHLLQWWEELDAVQQQRLLEQIADIDFEQVQSLTEGRGEVDGESATRRAARARPPESLVRQPESGGDPGLWREAEQCGRDLLHRGAVGAILVAGGQGTRLGFNRPKGMFPIGPVSGKSLFQLHCEQLRARARTARRSIPYFIMTSEATHQETFEFFTRNGNFGLSSDDVYFFQQGSLPAVDARSSRILMAAKDRVCTSPDGHGGLLDALQSAGLLEVMCDRGIEQLYYHQVDNPTALICDPAFLGLHAMHASEASTKVVAKSSAAERMGVVVSVDHQTEIVEYSDLSPAVAGQTDRDGRLLLWAGSAAIHVFDRRFLADLSGEDGALPYHLVRKAVPCIDNDGEQVVPDTPNAHKFERFIFDVLPHAERALVVEADRSVEFNPAKNASGEDSPETARAALLRNARCLLETAGYQVADNVHVELSPLFAETVEELRRKLEPGRRFDSDVVLDQS